MIKQGIKIVLLLMFSFALAFGAKKSSQFDELFPSMVLNHCVVATGAPIPKFKTRTQILAYEKKNKKYFDETMAKYNVEGCVKVAGDAAAEMILGLCTGEVLLGAMAGKDYVDKVIEGCFLKNIKVIDKTIQAEVKKAKPFPKVDKAAQAQKEKEQELERQRQIQAEEEARLEAIEKENRILATRLAALGEYIWENDYHRIYAQSNRERFAQDLQGCVQERQENLDALAKEAKFFSQEQENDEQEIKVDESIKKQSVYQDLAYCVIKPHFDEYELQVKQEKWQEIKAEVLDSVFIKDSLANNESALNKHIEKLALASFESSWAEMAEKKGYDDYESVIISPWFAKDDIAKILVKQTKEPLGKLDTLKSKLFEESNPQYKQCDKDFFRKKKKEECRQNELNSSTRALEEQIENLAREIQIKTKEQE